MLARRSAHRRRPAGRRALHGEMLGELVYWLAHFFRGLFGGLFDGLLMAGQRHGRRRAGRCGQAHAQDHILRFHLVFPLLSGHGGILRSFPQKLVAKNFSFSYNETG